jgi:hypothetical protein
MPPKDRTKSAPDQFDEQTYRHCQLRDQAKDDHYAALYRQRLIHNGDPECERVISALEQGWSTQKDRGSR